MNSSFDEPVTLEASVCGVESNLPLLALFLVAKELLEAGWRPCALLADLGYGGDPTGQRRSN